MLARLLGGAMFASGGDMRSVRACPRLLAGSLVAVLVSATACGAPADAGVTVCAGDATSPSLAAAVADAPDGATISICGGFYAERLTVAGKRLALVGMEDAAGTVIDGGGAGPVITITAGADVTIRGLTFQNGVAEEGGALLCDASKVAITDSVLRDSAAGDIGGGAALRDCTGVLAGNAITGNRARVGGGLTVIRGALELTGNTIADNTATNDGGGIYFHHADGAVFQSNHVHHNRCDDDGGGVRIFETAMTVVDNLVEDNTTADGGGGIRVSHVPSLFIANVIRNNDAGGTGGGIDMDNDASTIMGGEISGNHASGSGGGIFHWIGPWEGAVLSGIRIANNRAYRGGGIFLDDNFEPVTMAGLVVAGNRADKGGGIMVRGTHYTIRNSIFVANEGERGGAIYAGVNSSTPSWTEPCPPCPPTEPVGHIEFSTFHGNEADEGAALWIDTARVTVGSSIVSASNGPAVTVKPPPDRPGTLTPPRWSYNDTFPATFAGMFDPTGRDGNLSAPPQFMDAAAGDFRLEPGSACIDAGDPAMRDPDGSRADMGSHGGPQ